MRPSMRVCIVFNLTRDFNIEIPVTTEKTKIENVAGYLGLQIYGSMTIRYPNLSSGDFILR